MLKFKPRALALPALVTATILPSLAHAAIDVAPLVEEIKGNSTSVTSVGLAVLGVIAVILGFSLMKRIMR